MFSYLKTLEHLHSLTKYFIKNGKQECVLGCSLSHQAKNA